MKSGHIRIVNFFVACVIMHGGRPCDYAFYFVFRAGVEPRQVIDIELKSLPYSCINS